jgi:hypothetical protein
VRGVVALGRDKARQQGPAAASGSQSGQGGRRIGSGRDGEGLPARRDGPPGVHLAQLIERLAALGVDDNERNLRNKVARVSSPQDSCYNAWPRLA